MTPLVSILIPTLDRPRYLREAIEAALAQTYRNLQVLVFDNGALEETRAVVGRAVAHDPRVIFRRHPRNLGMSANFNTLADAARGEFVVAIGDDDRLLPEFVSHLVEVMRPEVRVAFSNQYLIDAEGRRLEEESRAYNRQYGRETLPAGLVAKPQAAAWRQSIPMSASLLRTADMQRLRFREDLNTPDAEFFIRLAQEGAQFYFLPEYLMEYRIHPDAVTVGGHWSEQLVECLSPLEVSSEIEPYKRRFLTPMVVNAVSRCLQQGKMEMARRLLQNEYYPRRRLSGGEETDANSSVAIEPAIRPEPAEHRLRHSLTILLQRFCANLPASIGAPLYRAVRRVSPHSLSQRRGLLSE